MTNGQKLKKTLGLDNFKDVYITRILLPSSQKINMVVYDSLRGKMTKRRFTNLPYVSMLFSGRHLNKDEYKKPSNTPLMDIDNWNGNLENYVFSVVDLAYSFWHDKDKFTRLPEAIQKRASMKSCVILPKTALDEITLFDLKSSDVVSTLTKNTTKVRQKNVGNANKNTKLIDCDINTNDGSVVFKFLTEVTTGIYPKGYEYSDVNPKNSKISLNKSKSYELWIKVSDVFGKDGWLSTYPEKQTLTRADIKDILEVSDVQLWSNDLSFTFQGFQYWLDQIDASIFSQDIKPARWDKYHGDGQAFLTKHFNQLIRSIAFFLNQMASMLNKKLKDRGIL